MLLQLFLTFKQYRSDRKILFFYKKEQKIKGRFWKSFWMKGLISGENMYILRFILSFYASVFGGLIEVVYESRILFFLKIM